MKKILIFSILLVTGLKAQVPSGAAAFWPFDGNAQDLSGNGSNGVVNGATPAPNRFGTPNKAYKFNGINNYIVVNDNSFVDVANGTDFSFSYWQKSYPGNTDQAILLKHDSGSWNGYNFVGNNQSNGGYCTAPSHMYWYCAAGAFQDACSDAAVLADTNWRCIVGVYDAANNEAILYINGVQQIDVGQASGNLSNTANLYFGGDAPLNAYYFKGVLDQARLYKRKLTQNEINQLCNETECVAPAPPTDLTALKTKSFCRNSTAALTAQGSGTITWYSSPTATNSLGTGTVFTTPSLAPGTYTYYVQSTTCDKSLRTAITITVSACTGIDINSASPDLFQVFPNPNSGNFTLRAELFSGNSEVVIVNQLGMTVFKTKINSYEMALETGLPAGIYFLNVLDNERVVDIRKIVVDK